MRKNKLNNTLLIIGILIAASTPLAVLFLTGPIAKSMCVPQPHISPQMCLDDPRAILYTFFGPLVLGAIIILVSVLRRK